MNSPLSRLVRTEIRLLVREPLAAVFVFVFPAVTMLIIGGAFGTKPSSAYDWTNPSHWYVASYLTVVIAATGLIMVPVHLAAYRERGVLQRFRAAGFPRASFAVAQLVTGMAAVAVGAAVLLAVAAPVYGIPHLDHPARVLAGMALGSLAFVSIGVLLGSLLPSARSAQAVGFVLFFPSFLLGAGGPPPKAMGAGLQSVANYLPLTRVTESVRGPWLGTGMATGSLVIVALVAVVASVLAVRRSAL